MQNKYSRRKREMEEKTGAVIYAPVYVKVICSTFLEDFAFYGQIALADFASTTRFNAIR